MSKSFLPAGGALTCPRLPTRPRSSPVHRQKDTDAILHPHQPAKRLPPPPFAPSLGPAPPLCPLSSCLSIHAPRQLWDDARDTVGTVCRNPIPESSQLPGRSLKRIFTLLLIPFSLFRTEAFHHRVAFPRLLTLLELYRPAPMNSNRIQQFLCQLRR